ncbi:hypothetical protein E2C01_071301 [Portunus trituberculatus]|uniref:Uncharacterized protein n=1 Tax=Portunus trituberculatus TaxID=210409 RepID=A0A5B7I4M5_PORTR|nr:hypothetical protein [Portunus trituberculatus]
MAATRLLPAGRASPLEFSSPRYCATLAEDRPPGAAVATVTATHKHGEYCSPWSCASLSPPLAKFLESVDRIQPEILDLSSKNVGLTPSVLRLIFSLILGYVLNGFTYIKKSLWRSKE